jgi:hypothetical protein
VLGRERIAGNRSDRNRRILQALRAPLCRDNDFRNLAAIRGGYVRGEPVDCPHAAGADTLRRVRERGRVRKPAQLKSSASKCLSSKGTTLTRDQADVRIWSS